MVKLIIEASHEKGIPKVSVRSRVLAEKVCPICGAMFSNRRREFCSMKCVMAERNARRDEKGRFTERRARRG